MGDQDDESDERARRRYEAAKRDQRDPFERDRDRILYSSAFHRLAGVTQIVRAGEEDVFHTRQQHSIKVAQVGRRLAEYCLSKQSGSKDRAEELGINADVVEAACLAHDLGHPPFGHAGEAVLDRLVQNPLSHADGNVGGGDPDGFEGNAQTFRILTKLGVRHPNNPGLDLTRATLASVLKYPWMRDHSDKNRCKKWSVFRSEKEDFEFARKFHPHSHKTIEAELMDFADDIAYSVHDLEDFHRCNAVPWQVIFRDENKQKLVKNTLSRWHAAPPEAPGYLNKGMEAIENLFLLHEKILLEPYVGSREQRWWLRNLTSTLVGTFLKSVSIDPVSPTLNIVPENLAAVLLLKQITNDYIFTRPALSAQQQGQAKLIQDLFLKIHQDSCYGSWPSFLPNRLHYLWDLSKEESSQFDNRPRFAADCIASLTENEVVRLHARLFGSSSGSVLHPIVR